MPIAWARHLVSAQLQEYQRVCELISGGNVGAMALSGVKAAEEALKVFDERKRQNAF